MKHGDINMPGGADTVGHSSVQAWSAGDIFPATIGVVESYYPPAEYRGPLQGAPAADSPKDFELRRRWVAYDLTLDGVTERFATYDDARSVAEVLVRDPVARRCWGGGVTASGPEYIAGRVLADAMGVL